MFKFVYGCMGSSKTVQAIIVDEAQFLSPTQVDQLAAIADEFDMPVICFGLATDFRTNFFPGSRRLFEIADELTEIRSVCRCGRKATVNARIDDKGNVVYSGETTLLGGNDRYTAMCRRCWLQAKVDP